MDILTKKISKLLPTEVGTISSLENPNNMDTTIRVDWEKEGVKYSFQKEFTMNDFLNTQSLWWDREMIISDLFCEALKKNIKEIVYI